MPFSANSPAVTISISDPGFGAVTFRGAAGANQVDPNGFRVLYKKGDSFPKTEKHDIEYSWIAIGSFT